MTEDSDLTRLRAEYAKRTQQLGKSDRYSLFNPAQLFIVQQRQRAMLKCLRRNGFYPLSEQRILELGCGSGRILLETLSFGAAAGNVHGAELLFERVAMAHHTLTSLPLVCADGQNLPYTAHSFDLSMQFMVFSSILDHQVKYRLAQELLRITRPGGMILWYDFWLNPANAQTRGIDRDEIRGLFPNCRFQFERLTLAPPLARRITPISWGLALWLESLRILNTHYLVAIRPN